MGTCRSGDVGRMEPHHDQARGVPAVTWCSTAWTTWRRVGGAREVAAGQWHAGQLEGWETAERVRMARISGGCCHTTCRAQRRLRWRHVDVVPNGCVTWKWVGGVGPWQG